MSLALRPLPGPRLRLRVGPFAAPSPGLHSRCRPRIPADTGGFGAIQAVEASQCLDAGSETIVLEPPSPQKTYRSRDRSTFDRWGPSSHSACGPRRASTGSSPRRSASM
jgi:hypothetical protein